MDTLGAKANSNSLDRKHGWAMDCARGVKCPPTIPDRM